MRNERSNMWASAIAMGAVSLSLLAIRDAPLHAGSRPESPLRVEPSPFAVPTPAPTFPLSVDVAGRRLLDAAGRPFFVNGDAAWSLMVRLTRDEADRYLQARRRRGFNTVLVNIVEHYFGGPSNRYGQQPFLTPGDLSTPNEAYFAHVDWVVGRAAQHGMLVLLTPLYLGYQGGPEGWYQEMLSNGVAKCRDYGRYLGARYASFPNIVWVEGGDSGPLAGIDEVNAIVAGIKDFDSVHLHTAHTGPVRSALDDYDQPWLDVNTTYTYRSCATVVARSRIDYLRTRPLPFFFIEGWYEGEGAPQNCLLEQAYLSVLSGARGHVFGNRPIWLFDAGWELALASPGADWMRHFGALFASRSGDGLVPDLGHEVVADPLGGDVSAARTADGRSVLAYLPTGPTTLRVNTTMLSSTQVQAWWYDPQLGVSRDAGRVLAAGNVDFHRPSDRPWVLVVDDAASGLGAPGSGRRSHLLPYTPPSLPPR